MNWEGLTDRFSLYAIRTAYMSKTTVLVRYKTGMDVCMLF